MTTNQDLESYHSNHRLLYCIIIRQPHFQHSEGASPLPLPFTTVNGLEKMVDDVLHIQDGRGGEILPA